MSKRSKNKRRGATTKRSAQNAAARKAPPVQASSVKPAARVELSTTSTQPETVCPLQRLGATLRHAREALNLSLEDVAAQSLVHTRFIQCLEQGRDPGVAPTYVRGYLRLLAEHLDIPSDQLLGLFDEAQSSSSGAAASNGAAATVSSKNKSRTPIRKPIIRQATAKTSGLGALLRNTRIALGHGAQEADRSGKKVAVKTEVSSASAAKRGQVVELVKKDYPKEEKQKQAPKAIVRDGTAWQTPSILHNSAKRISLQTIALPMIGLLLAAAVYVSNEPGTSGAEAVAIASESEPLGKLASTALGSGDSGESVVERALVPLNREERQAALAGLDGFTEAEPADSRMAAIESSVEPSAPAVDSPLGESVRSIINVGAISARSNQVSPTGSAPLVDSYEPVGPGAEYMIAQQTVRDRLVISVYEDSWVDVRDANGVRLYRDLAKAGRRIDLSGQLPFSLHVGNAPGLALELNGNYVPIQRYRPDNSARLTLATNPAPEAP